MTKHHTPQRHCRDICAPSEEWYKYSDNPLDSLPNKPGKVITFEMREWAPLPPLPRSIFLMFKEDYKDLIDFFKEDNTNCICSSLDIFNFGCPSAHGKTCRSK